MADVEVGLGAVLGDEDLAVLERVHRPGVDVEVRVELLHRHPQPAGLEQAAEAEAVRPLPSEEATPPVTKRCLVWRLDCAKGISRGVRAGRPDCFAPAIHGSSR